jgi:hypothetical protein
MHMLLYGTPCVQCGQPANRMLITQQRIVHSYGSLKDCDAGARNKGMVVSAPAARRGRSRV